MSTIINHFNTAEIQNFSTFVLLCEVLQESVIMRRDLESTRQRISQNCLLNQINIFKYLIATVNGKLEIFV